MEVMKNGEWGTICDDHWNLLSATVVCRELGFGSAKEALSGGQLGQGTHRPCCLFSVCFTFIDLFLNVLSYGSFIPTAV